MGRPPRDLSVGSKYGRLTAMSFSHVSNKRKYWLCRCDCGVERQFAVRDIIRGDTKSCGCFRKDANVERLTKHGHAPQSGKTRTWGIWCKMVQRCTNPEDGKYADYGARGIGVCSRWRSFANFLADMGEAPGGRQIDRINNDGSYEPSNCRWATVKEQQNNRRSTVYIQFGAEVMPFQIAMDRAGIRRAQVVWRTDKHGMSHQVAFDAALARHRYAAELGAST